MVRKPIVQPALTAALCMAVASSPALAGDKKAADVLSGYEKTGESVNCVNRTQIRDQDPLDDYAILFETSGRKIYLNELSGRCIGLGREQRFSITSPETRMCAGEIITVLDNFGRALGSCSLGEFQELSEIEEPEEDTASL